MKILFVLIFLTSILSLGTQSAQAQVGGTGIPETSPVGVIPETPAPTEPDLPRMTLKLGGGGCEINTNESELLRVRGVVEVDIESQPGKIIVTYDPAVTNKQLIKAAVGRKKGGCGAAEDAGAN